MWPSGPVRVGERCCAQDMAEALPGLCSQLRVPLLLGGLGEAGTQGSVVGRGAGERPQHGAGECGDETAQVA